MICKGIFKHCLSTAIIGHTLCKDCNDLRLDKIKKCLCTNGDCLNPTNTGEWCRQCYTKKIDFKYDYSMSSECTCSLCYTEKIKH